MPADKVAREKEEEYFARKEFERRKQLEQERQAKMADEERCKAKDLHWMCCPKCGMALVEIDFQEVKIDKCSACGGVFLDDGEMQQIIEGNRTGVLQRMFKVLR